MERVETFVLTRGLNASQVLSFVHELETFKADVFFEKRRTSANGKSVLGMMSLFTSIRLGDKVELKVYGKKKMRLPRWQPDISEKQRSTRIIMAIGKTKQQSM
ncbi:HPr family phosphocarrier protein [Marinococcus halophilus]|uniref:HPr family phosphocarrier protein n=1 Tax=Marinococcus halophilus TaxID=1371 RepID=UPI00361C20B9